MAMCDSGGRGQDSVDTDLSCPVRLRMRNSALVALLGMCSLSGALSPGALAQSPVRVVADSILARRMGPAPQEFFEMLGLPDARSRDLTDSDREKVEAALGFLTPLHRRVLGERLAEISFVEGMPNNALTYPHPGDPTESLYNVTIRAGVLDETVSELLTRKERTCFDTGSSPLELLIEAGEEPALVYVLLHEATHIVDRTLSLTPSDDGDIEQVGALVEGVWESRLVSDLRYRHPLLEGSCYRTRGAVYPISDARAVYEALAATPFASLYGNYNWHDDIAELATWYHLTARLGRPYRIEIRQDGETVFSYEPMKSPLVRARLGEVQRFYRAP